ncbi:hypothetical protein EV182_004243 [Spiromyces aspiralis]|uniref:Uncharacterized protein n=1 Tax=Spiromyces aspiralis TaxID=68401 RepID=A0ACC1HF13_9FUNG|nr:hypothetical protein EV182_004243 [Spiromyces aspiralis]
MHACFSVQVLSSMQDMLGGGYSKGVCCGYLDLPGYLGRVMLGALRTDLSGESWWFLRIDAEDYDAMLMNNGNGNGGYGQFGGDLRRLLFVLEDKDMSRSVKLSRPLIAQEWYTLCVWKSGSIQLSDTHGEILAQLTIDFDAEDVNGQHLWLLRIHPELAFKVRQLCP